MEPGELQVFGEQDGDLDLLREQMIAVLGYGNLGRPLALNLRDSGLERIVIGDREGATAEQALEDGFQLRSFEEATRCADVILFLVPDEVQPNLYCERLASCVQPGSAVVFASGYNLTFHSLPLSPELDVLLFAPRMLGKSIRRLYLDGRGFFSFVSVQQDGSGQAWPRLLALAKACGSLRRGALHISARQEVDLDLFGEQGFGPWLGAAIMSAVRVGVEQGLPLEGVLLELYLSGEMSESFRIMAEEGFLPSTRLHGYAATYGGMMRSVGIDRQAIEASMREALSDIQSGGFARAWAEELEAGCPSQSLLEEMLRATGQIAEVEERLREKCGTEETSCQPPVR